MAQGLATTGPASGTTWSRTVGRIDSLPGERDDLDSRPGREDRHDEAVRGAIIAVDHGYRDQGEPRLDEQHAAPSPRARSRFATCLLRAERSAKESVVSVPASRTSRSAGRGLSRA